MFPINPKHQPTLTQAIIILILIIGLISYFMIFLEASPHIPILLAIFLLIGYGLINKISYADLQTGMAEGAKTGMSAVFLFFLIGILMGTWMISGTIPVLIHVGFSFIDGTWLYAIVFAITSLIGISLGSSLTTTATIGIAFIGLASAMDASLAITAGAIVSGSFFGDKMSPLSDTTNLASTIIEVDLFDHIKHISLTTIPAFIISFILFAVLSPDHTMPLEEANLYTEALINTHLIHWGSWLPLIILILCAFFKLPAFISLGISCLFASGVALFTSGYSFSDIWNIWFNGYVASTDFEPVNDLLSRGGMSSMFSTIALVLLALGFGGLLFVTGVIPTILAQLQKKLTRVRSIIASTAATAIGVNLFIGEQYLSILLTGETFKPIYQKSGIPNKVLARTLEDAGTVINPLVPWSVCGVFIADVLNVPVLTYLPFAFFCLLSPIITIIFSGRKVPTRR